MEQYHQLLSELREPTNSLRRPVPDTWAGFVATREAGMTDGEVPARLKEAVALAISVIKRFDGCIADHAKAAAKEGATAGEVAEILGVTLLMDGGTASVYAPRAMRAFNEFTDDSAPIQVAG